MLVILVGISNIWCYNIGVGHVVWAKKMVGNVAYLFWSNFHFLRMSISLRSLLDFKFRGTSIRAFTFQTWRRTFLLEKFIIKDVCKVGRALKKEKIQVAWCKWYEICMFWKKNWICSKRKWLSNIGILVSLWVVFSMCSWSLRRLKTSGKRTRVTFHLFSRFLAHDI